MSFRSTATVPTASASRYLQQLAKHWSHKMEVKHSTTDARIVMPQGAVVQLEAKPDSLIVRIDVASAEGLPGVKGAVARHINRFAFREAPLSFDWREE